MKRYEMNLRRYQTAKAFVSANSLSEAEKFLEQGKAKIVLEEDKGGSWFIMNVNVFDEKDNPVVF